MTTDGPHPAAWRDLTVLRAFFWLPILTVVFGVLAALVLGALAGSTEEARFRTTVFVDAPTPLFGPPLVPGPFEYIALATSDAVVEDVAAATGQPAGALRVRMSAEPRANTPEISFRVTGEDALELARAWETAFTSAAAAETAVLQREMTSPYRTQLEQSAARLTAAAAAAAANPEQPVLAQELAAAEENHVVAARLVQSYDIVAETIVGTPVTVSAPRLHEGGVGTPAGRIAAGAAVGLLAGVLAAVGLAAAQRRRPDAPLQAPPAPLRREGQRSGTRG